jgi:hypothetical protein
VEAWCAVGTYEEGRLSVSSSALDVPDAVTGKANRRYCSQNDHNSQKGKYKFFHRETPCSVDGVQARVCHVSDVNKL